MSRAIRSSGRLLSSVTKAPVPLIARPWARFGSTTTSSSSEEVYPEEGFNAPFWTKLAIGGLALALVLRLAPAPPEATGQDEDADNNQAPWITRYITHNLTPATDLWKQRNERHLELSIEAANDKLLFQEAEKPKIRRLRYLGSFDQASPNLIPVGSQADLSDLVIKHEKDDFAKLDEAAADEDDE
ncbi:hypothetical protein OIO90_001694 [Microbotryomycetes sp. JL221]|nr:hypothetical protein OIO90_001694 [Microbotryomycetes sp. JL221]